LLLYMLPWLIFVLIIQHLWYNIHTLVTWVYIEICLYVGFCLRSNRLIIKNKWRFLLRFLRLSLFLLKFLNNGDIRNISSSCGSCNRDRYLNWLFILFLFLIFWVFIILILIFIFVIIFLFLFIIIFWFGILRFVIFFSVLKLLTCDQVRIRFIKGWRDLKFI